MREFSIKLIEGKNGEVEITADFEVGGKENATEPENAAAYVLGRSIQVILKNPVLCIAHGEGKTIGIAEFRRDIDGDIQKAGK